MILATLLLAGAQASAATTILDCNLFQGDLQQVVVVREGSSYLLRELTSYGRWFQRPLTTQEFQSKKLVLRAEAGVATLTKTSQGWFFDANSPGLRERGYADCR